MSIDELRLWAKKVRAESLSACEMLDLAEVDDELSAEVSAIAETADLIVDMCEEREPSELDFEQ